MNYRRFENLEERGSATEAELDERRNELEVAEQAVEEAEAQINATRAALGLKTDVRGPARPARRPRRAAAERRGVAGLGRRGAGRGRPAGRPARRRPRRPLQPDHRRRGGRRHRGRLRPPDRRGPPDQGGRGPDRPGRAAARRRRAEPELHRDPLADRRLRRAPIGPPRRPRPARPGAADDPPADGLDRRQLQGDAARRPRHRPAGRAPRRRLPRPRLPGPGRRLQPGDGRGLVAAAAGERHGQLREGRPATAGPDRADRAAPAETPLFVGLSVMPKVRLDAIPTGPRRRQAPHRARAADRPGLRRRRSATAGETLDHRPTPAAGCRSGHERVGVGGGTTTGSSRSRSRWRRSWRCSTPPSPTSRCGTSPAAWRRPGARAPGC